MDILNFIKSNAMRNHFRSIGYKFNIAEAAWIINRYPDMDMREKYKYLRKLKEKYPDMGLRERLNLREITRMLGLAMRGVILLI